MDFRALVEASNAGVVSVDHRGQVVFWNRAAKALFGYDADEPPGGPLSALLPGCAPAATPGPAGPLVELLGRRRDGTDFPAEVSLSSMVTDEGRFTLAAIRDVSARRRADQALRASEERYRRIIETTHEGVCITDADYRYLFVNRRLEEMLGYGPGELVGLNVFDLIDEAGAVEQRKRIERRRGGKPESGELALKRKDGSFIWVMFESHSITEAGRFQGVLSMIMDITERRRVEARLRQSEAQLREAQEIAHLGSWDWDLVNSTVSRSEEYRRILGLERDDTTAGDYEKVHPEDRERVRQDLEHAIRERKPWLCDYRLLRGTEVRIVHARGEVVVDAAGAAVRMVGTVQDVTERKQAEARILLSDRLVSVGTLALGVAHEINNPLAYVTANLDLIAEEIGQLTGGSPSGRLRELLDMTNEAREGAARVRKIVRGLKTFSRGDEDRPVPLDVRRVLEVAINMAFNEIRHRARLVKDYGAAPPVVADEGRLGQVFINLLVNAAQALPEGQPERNEIRIVTRTLADGRALVEVHDTGPGIPDHLVGRIFDPFFTTKAVGVGTGLGLSICHGIVSGLGGELTVESEVGRGSTFRVLLPAAPSAAAEALSVPPVKAQPGKRSRVLVVDDDPMVASALGRVLRDHDVLVTGNGREALDALASGRSFDVILCDLMMPVMTGMELHAHLRAALPGLAERMIFITGGAFTPSARAFLDEVPNERLEKPFDAHNLRAIVQRAAR